jgi:copper(I)-binding protein
MSVTVHRPPVLGLAAGAVAVVAAAVVLTWTPYARSGAPKLRVTGAYVPAPASPDVAAAYFTVLDSGRAGDVLTGVASDISAETMMHRSTGQAMEMVGSVRVPAHGRLVFAPGGYHVMLNKPTRRLRAGDHVTLTLQFQRSAAITVSAPVEPIGWRPDGG